MEFDCGASSCWIDRVEAIRVPQVPELTHLHIIAREVSGYRTRFKAIEKRLVKVKKVNARLEDAALITARALQEISGRWNAVYEAMRRRDESQLAAEQ